MRITRNWFLQDVSINFHFYRAECMRMTKHSPFNMYHILEIILNKCAMCIVHTIIKIEKFIFFFPVLVDILSFILKLWIPTEQIIPNSNKLIKRITFLRYLRMCAWVSRKIQFNDSEVCYYRSKFTAHVVESD